MILCSFTWKLLLELKSKAWQGYICDEANARMPYLPHYALSGMVYLLWLMLNNIYRSFHIDFYVCIYIHYIESRIFMTDKSAHMIRIVWGVQKLDI